MLDFQDFQIYEIHCDYFVGADKVQTLDQTNDLGVLFVKQFGVSLTKRASKMLGFLIKNGKDFRNNATKSMLFN